MDVLSVMQKLRGLTLRRVTFFIWTVTFCYLIWDDNYTLFLKPSFGFLIYAGMAISILFTMGTCLDIHPSSRPGSETINALFLLIPILFILSAGDKTLGSAALSKRTIAMPTSEMEMPILSLPEPPGDMAMDKASNDNHSIEISMSELLKNWAQYSGKSVTFEGLFYNAMEGGESHPMVFKYLITCCAADALPVAVFLEDAPIEPLIDDDWIRVTGVVTLEKKYKNQDAIFMKVRSIEKVPKPSKAATYIFF